MGTNRFKEGLLSAIASGKATQIYKLKKLLGGKRLKIALLATVIVSGVVLFLVVDWDRDELTTITEFRSGTSIFDSLVLDSDADGLEDGDEINYYQTNPLESDTDDDGLPDGLEVNILGSNPLRMDIFVEVDWMSTTLASSAISRLIKEFADAPIQNPDGSTGITLHIDLDEQVPAVNEISKEHKSGDLNDFGDYKEYYFSQREGFHYALICVVVTSYGRILGGSCPGYDFMVGTFRPDLFDGYYYPPDVVGAIFMHELGHAIGLRPGVYEGIDSYRVPFSDYTSVMNYNTPRVPTDTDNAFYGYSNEGEFSDWGYLQEHGLEAPARDIVSHIARAQALFSVSPGEFTVVEVPPLGEPFRLEQKLVIRNGDTITRAFVITVRAPPQENTSPGYEPIPNENWIILTPLIEIEENSSDTVEMSLNIPRWENLTNKKWEAWISIRRIVEPGELIEIELISKAKIITTEELPPLPAAPPPPTIKNPLIGPPHYTTIDDPLLVKVPDRTIEGTVTSGEVGGTIKVYFNGVHKSEYDLVTTTTTWSVTVTLPAGQTNKIEVTLTDKVGVESDKVLYGYTMLDASAPMVTITAPESGLSTDATSIILAATGTKDTWETYAEITVRIDATSLTAPFTATNMLSETGVLTRAIELVEGTNTISVSAQDVAGNWSTVKTVTVTRTLLTSLKISEENFTLQAGESKYLTATFTSDGSPLVDKLITWSTTAGTIAPSSGKTNTAGQVTVVYTAPSYEAYVIVSASYAGSEQYKQSSVNSYGTIAEPSTGTSMELVIGIPIVIGCAIIGAALYMRRRKPTEFQW